MPGFKRDASLYDVGVGASWELDLFGGLRRGAEAARAEADAAEAERLGARVSVHRSLPHQRVRRDVRALRHEFLHCG